MTRPIGRCLVLLTAALAACHGGGDAAPTPPAAPEPRAWTARSADGRAVLTSAPAPVGCRLTATVGGAEAWQAEGCAATSRDLVFLAPDGERFVVLFGAPAVAGLDWSLSVCGAAYRRGTAERWLSAEALVGRERLATARQEPGCVRGAGGEGGPRVAPDGRGVVLTAAGGAVRTVAFDGALVSAENPPAPAVTPPPPAMAAAEATADEPPPDSIWRWEDAQGDVHYDRWSALTPQARRKARPVNASIGSVKLDRTARPASGGAPPPAAGRAPAPAVPDIHKGPRLNGLTDGERALEEKRAAEAAARKKAEEDAAYARMRERERQLDRDRGNNPSYFNR